MSPYLDLRHKAMVLRDIGGYDLGRGEMNPAIFEEFIGEVFDSRVPSVVWEPFAGHTGRSRMQDFARDAGLELVSFDLEPSDPRVTKVDSTKRGPERVIGGVLFHPPYFGTGLMSKDEADLSAAGLFDDYVKALQKTVDFVKMSLVYGGFVCAVGRDYLNQGMRVRLDVLYLEMFGGIGMSLKQVWLSEPDVVLIFKRET